MIFKGLSIVRGADLAQVLAYARSISAPGHPEASLGERNNQARRAIRQRFGARSAPQGRTPRQGRMLRVRVIG